MHANLWLLHCLQSRRQRRQRIMEWPRSWSNSSFRTFQDSRYGLRSSSQLWWKLRIRGRHSKPWTRRRGIWMSVTNKLESRWTLQWKCTNLRCCTTLKESQSRWLSPSVFQWISSMLWRSHFAIIKCRNRRIFFHFRPRLPFQVHCSFQLELLLFSLLKFRAS